jgi:hypothetical protein
VIALSAPNLFNATNGPADQFTASEFVAAKSAAFARSATRLTPRLPPKSVELVAAVQPIGRAYAIATRPCTPAAATGCARVAAVTGQYRAAGDAARATVARLAVARAEPAAGAGHSRVAGKAVSPRA